MFNLSDTICAICTSPGVGSIAAIRISGPDSWKIIKKFFFAKDAAQSCLQHMHALHGYIKDNEKTLDEVVILPYKSPNSFTREDVIEIFCHGGSKVSSMILDLCLKNGARRASGGEFTFRAFINGRIDLTEAEAINEIINADTTRAVYAASDILSGSLKEKVNSFRDRLFNLITTIESAIEFPMDVPAIQKDKIISQLNDINLELNQLVQDSESGQILRSGIKVSIIGAPNVGKSSLLNQLVENERAIVTSEAGTTRDTIEEKIIIDGYPFVLVDTAGIREAESLSSPERLGIDRSKWALENSDIVLLVLDLTRKNDNDTKRIFEILNGKPKIVAGNKIDLIDINEQHLQNIDIAISAKYGTNLDKLKKLLLEKMKYLKNLTSHDGQNSTCYINQRQKELLLQCSSIMDFVIELANKNDGSEDLIADELKKAISKLDEVSGRKINEDVIINIFAKFCIGK
ncbi:MAG: tRNA uridine-5-carboxymethylaminomethyl(34) synthesis GTPase MnmE [Candidatus Melainabacteria bacterium]|nr:tRNA uridine-5-carboxymethylaminomethyl(34) synthesis GTPase MnmE [Candidatus Melainabacteria bacterium]